MKNETSHEVQALITDIWAAARILARGAIGDYSGVDGLPDLICTLADMLAGQLGLSSPVELGENEQRLMQVYREMPKDAQEALYRMGISVRFVTDHDLESSEADILAFYQQLTGEGQRIALDLMGILAGEWLLPIK